MNDAAVTPADRLERPSSLYRAKVWRFGQMLAGGLPRPCSALLAQFSADIYSRVSPTRRQIVVDNLVPVLGGDQAAARSVSRRLFRQFAIKLTDLLRYESGLPITGLFHHLTGWEHLASAQARGRGVLLMTLHLGNWEFGAPLLTRRGVKLQVITGPEPQLELTTLRQEARARWGVETLALNDDFFASVEIVRRLESNYCVALLMDRPPAATAVSVRLFGRPFLASVSAAELGRASGCALLPVFIPRTAQGYVGYILPEIRYDRPALRDRAARISLTQEIMNVFEPVIRQYADQWYHFVPIWSPRSGV
jgi:lauroyl/myristoyl acyltransferase